MRRPTASRRFRQVCSYHPRDIKFLDWGFVFDAKDAKIKEGRVVTVRDDELSAPRYLSLYRFKRCLILADGLYGWQSEK